MVSYTVQQMLDELTPSPMTRLSFDGAALTVISTYNIFSDFESSIPTTSNFSSPLMLLSAFGLTIQEDWSVKLNVTTCELDIAVDACDLKSRGGVLDAKLRGSTELLKAFVPNPSESVMELDLYRLDTFPPALSPGQSVAPSIESPPHSGLCYSFRKGNQFQALYNLVNEVDVKYSVVMNRTSYGASYATENDSSRTIFDAAGLSPDMNISFTTGDEAYVCRDEGPGYIMSNLAASLNQITLNPNQNLNGTSPVYGRASLPTTLVRVTWPWVILPLGLCLCAIVFFLATVYVSSRAGAPLWKSSINAFFYHGIDFDTGVWTPLATMPEMDAQAADTRARLAPVGITRRLMLETMVARTERVNTEDI